jgi:Leucine-rich repeat (LRR) protein
MLVADRTQISNDGLRHLVDSSVTELDLTSCPAITDEGIAYLEGRQFKRLGLAGTKITDNALKSVQGMTSLGHLDVSGTAITNDGLRFLEPLTHLRYLLLNETDISDDGLRYLGPLKSLHTLSLKGTSISDDGLSFLATYHNLNEHLVLSNTKVTATGVATLQKALPDCKIDYGPLVTDDPDRDVAEQIIGIEGTLFVILEDGTKTTIQGAEALAKVGRFAIYNVSMPYNSAVNDDLLRQLVKIETLSVLDIPGTRITDDGIAALQGSLKIGVLRLDSTAVTDEAMPTVGTWKRLRELRLSGTKVTDIGIRHLADLPELYLLYLAGTAVTDKGLRSLKSIRSLEQLNLHGTAVSGEGLRDLDQITWLDLAQTHITDADVKKIKGLRLERLNLGATKITGEALRDLAEMKSLKNLEISNCGNGIGDADLVHLRSLADLSVLDLRGTNVTAAAVAELQGSLPDCKIAYSSQ